MKKIAVIGLGYVGLPLAVEFGKKRKVIGFDLNVNRINELKDSYDRTLEVDEDGLKSASHLTFTSELSDIEVADIYIITVPTPIDDAKIPDLTPLTRASKMIGSVLSKNNIVVYESTVYPGCTEEVCVPLLEKESQLKFNKDFFCGYSPERINPGDKVHTLTNIVKVTSGSTAEIATEVDELYQSILNVNTHKASSIKVAEASKVIENSQRDLNIAFVNELAIIFNQLGLDSSEVLEAAGTKWNFLKFKPGLVGGHCIGVDPYYLTYKAESVGYHPQVILAGRRINDNMGRYIANQVVKLMIKNDNSVKESKVLVLGITFKENCPDIRNSKVIDIIDEFVSFGVDVHVFDPHANDEEVKNEFSLDLIDEPSDKYDAIVLAVSHEEFLTYDYKKFMHETSIIYDVKSVLSMEFVDDRL